MAKKQAKPVTAEAEPDLEDAFKAIEDEWQKDDLPYLMSIPLGEPTPIVINRPSIRKCRDAGPDEDWSCYRLEAKTPDSEGCWEEIEIPWWNMKSFKRAYNAAKRKNPMDVALPFVVVRSIADGTLDMNHLEWHAGDWKPKGE